MKIGLIREDKSPADNRVVLTPEQAREAMINYQGLQIVVQPSPMRCYSDEEYKNSGVILQEDMSDCDVLVGVKEVPVDNLLAGKTYFMFSHTIKKQPYNKKLLQSILKKNIRLIDYECLTDDHGIRVIAFGRWAGIVGAHNGLYTWGKRTGLFSLKRAAECRDYSNLISQYQDVVFPPFKIATTGSGRVAKGANELLKKANIPEVSPEDFTQSKFDKAVFTNLKCEHIYRRSEDHGFDLQEFFDQPQLYQSSFRPYSRAIDLFINSIYWDPSAPKYFSPTEMAGRDFRIRAIADITCDIAPNSSVPSTLRPSTIDNPVYGYDPVAQSEAAPFQESVIDVMAVDNLPNELPRDASHSFGDQFLSSVLPELMQELESEFLLRATIAKSGDLTIPYEYLQDYVAD